MNFLQKYSYDNGEESEWVDAEDIIDPPESSTPRIGQPDIGGIGMIAPAQPNTSNDEKIAHRGFQVVDDNEQVLPTRGATALGDNAPEVKQTGFTDIQNLFEEHGEAVTPEIQEHKPVEPPPEDNKLFLIIGATVAVVVGFLAWNYYQKNK